MRHIGTQDFLIYFDTTRVDPYVLNFQTNLGLSADTAQATISMLNADSLESWKAYLTEVRIFVKNPFTGKYRQVFTGDIMGTNGSASRKSTGQVTYDVAGTYTWLDIPVPLYLNTNENLNMLRRFQLQAQNINIDALTTLFQNKQDLFQTDKTIEQIIRRLFDVLDQGYTEVTKSDTTYGFKGLFTRFKVMSDIDPKWRDKGFLDLMTFVQSTTIQAFYTYLDSILTQLMLEFYEDIDGSFRVKGPSWNDAIPYGHILDESVVDNVTKGVNWNQQPTRILSIGGKSEILEAASEGSPIDGLDTAMSIPVGLYIYGGKYYGMHFDSFLKDGATGTGATGTPSDAEVEGFHDDLSPRNVYPLGTYLNKQYEIQGVNGGKPHFGTDYYMSFETLRSQGVDGFVEEVRPITGGGNSITIRQTILGVTYYLTYMHLNALPKFQKGDPIKSGQVIGTTGGSGIGPPHLHFQVWKGGFDWGNQRALTVDPQKWLAEKGGLVAAASSSGGSGGSGGALPGTSAYKGPDRTSNGYQSGMKDRLSAMAKHDAVINRVCAQYGFNPLIVKVIGAIESSGNPNAVGTQTKYGRAIGLLQIIPGAVGVSVDASRLTDVAYSVEVYCRAMTEKMKMMTRNGAPHTAFNAAHYWYGANSSGLAYAAAFSEIYEGFPGRKRTDPIKSGTVSSKSTAEKKININPIAPGSGGSSLVRSLVQSAQTLSVMAVPVEGGTASRPASPTKSGTSFIEGTPGAGSPGPDGKPVVPPASTAPKKFVLASGRGWLDGIIQENRNGVDINLVWSIIKATSNFSTSYERTDDQASSPEKHHGLMALPASYLARKGLTVEEANDPAKNIYHGTQFYKECLAATGKHSFALLAYFLGGGGLGVVDDLKKKATAEGTVYSFASMLHLIEGVYEESSKKYRMYDYDAVAFTDEKPPVGRVIMGWVNGALDNYASLHGGTYIQGDPHRGFKDAIDYSARPGGTTVGLDPSGGGASGHVANGLSEKSLTLDIAKSVQTKVGTTGGLEVVLSRTGDQDLTLAQRARELVGKGASQNYRIQFGMGGAGISVFRQVGGAVGSGTLQSKLVTYLTPVAEKHGLRMNGARTADSAFLSGLGDKSGVIIELGHLDDEKDASAIRGTSYVEDAATAIANAILNATNADGGQVLVPGAPATDTAFPDFFAAYTPTLSEEERRFRMRFMALEMELIRAGGATGGDLASAEAYLELFSRYMMHVLRARATGLTVSCSVPMPMVRPGFNAWLEPTRTNKVFYVTGVQHTGGFQQGVQTTVQGAYLRDLKDYDSKMENNLFVSKTNFTAKDLMPVVNKKDMPDIIEKLARLKSSSPIIETGTSAYLKGLYTTPEQPNRSLVQGAWGTDMTPEEIVEKLVEHFETAPPVVLERKREVTAVFQKARDLYDEFLRER